jgi:epoxyqueuosine reductase
MQQKEWREITSDVFQTLFNKSAIKRAKYEGLMRNIRFLE